MSERRFRYAYNLVTYGAEPVERGIERLHRFGYDAVEVPGDPSPDMVTRIGAALAGTGMTVSSVSCLFTPDRDLTASSAWTRRNALDYLLRVAEMAGDLGAPVINVAPAAVNRVRFESAPEREWAWAVDGLRTAAQAAAGHSQLAIEPWNRYETHLINRLDQAVQLARDVGHPAVGVMADLFHMNIEERSPLDALAAGLPWLRHIQFADNTRAAPGTGTLRFRPYLELLAGSGYRGVIAFELFPAKAHPLQAVAEGSAPEFFDPYTRASIEYLLAEERDLGAEPVSR